MRDADVFYNVVSPHNIMSHMMRFRKDYGKSPSYVLIPDDPNFQHLLKQSFRGDFKLAVDGDEFESMFFKTMFGVPVLEYTGNTVELVH